MKYHPDKCNGDKTKEDKFKNISNAYDILKDKDKREKYDRFGKEGLKGMSGGGGDPFDVFNSFFGGGVLLVEVHLVGELLLGEIEGER